MSTTAEVITTIVKVISAMSDFDHPRSVYNRLKSYLSHYKKVILTTEEEITATLKVISATTNVILASEEVITATLQIMSATTK